MGRILRIVFSLFLIVPLSAHATGYQININPGIDMPSKGKRSNAYLLGGQFSVMRKMFRAQSAFTAMMGSGFLEGEAAIGFNIYLITPFVSETAFVHPFLTASGLLGIGTLKGKSRTDAGYEYGAGIDLKFWKRSGITLSVQQRSAAEQSSRYVLGIFSQK